MALVMGIVVAAVAWQRRNERRKARQMKREMKNTELNSSAYR
jgi:hypothetical protein